MTIYNGFDINTAATPKPWGTREEQVIKDIIDTLVGDAIGGVKATGGHVHNNLYYDASNTAVTIDGSGNATFIGTVGVNDLDVTGNIDAATIITTGAAGIGVTPTESKLEVQDTTASNGIVKLIGQNAYEMFIQSVTNSAATVGNRFSFNVNSNTGEFLFKNSSYDGILINQYGQVGVRNTSPGSTFEVSSTAAPCTVESSCWSTTDTHEASLLLQKSSSATINTLAETADDEALGVIKGLGVDSSSASRVAASISFAQDATAEATRVPGRIMFNTTDATNEVVERMRIDASGYVGIGTNSPTNIVDINFNGDSATEPQGIFINNISNTDTYNASIIFSNDSGSRKKASISLIDKGSYGYGDIVFALDGSDNGSVDLSTDEKFRITSDGNIGIGTDSPTTLLDINNDTFRLRTAKVPATAGAAGTTGSIAWGTDGGTSYLYVCIATNTWERVALATW